ncbi:MAG TPA: pectin acetylesterase-family hydrolase [Aquabacterium sp.]|uniref:pectin acetylesterase-family hydrolase n=1 Tax=Aquabacterium sp. TaxID=1872578 RepID=UPI002D8E02A6|nr:pectin acetylesterase-family hydrolase [Aquabacterium sp.]HET6788874.1 pectin acetylesterase-family hydrolase [Aquabacterium sp.]HEX5372109.1 pectin acetylesterase-family hydrolase [Aquabacterium sp.]
MNIRPLLSTAAKALATSLLTSLAAHAAYFQWEMIELPASSGASCGNGTPYRFFVNRTPFTSKTVVMFEGGGACWDQGACKGGTLLDAVNPDGIPTNYMTDWNRQAHLGLVTPFTMRVHPLQSVQTQSWNIVYLTYCTGDVHTGNKTAVYNNVDPANPMPYNHRGAVNAKAVAKWLAANLKQPDHLLLTGFSAGGVGSTANYPAFREILKPKKMALMADSGPLFDVPRNATPEQAPSVLLHNKIRGVWGLDGPEGLVTELIAKYPTAGNADNLGSVTAGIGKMFPNDRIGYTMFQEDTNFSAFSYQKFYPEIAAAPTNEERLKMLNVKWRQEITPWIDGMRPFSNVGWFIPNKRDINGSHCTTIVTFGGTSIVENGHKSVGVFLDNLLDGKGPVLRSYETKPTTQRVLLSDMFADWLAPLVP